MIMEAVMATTPAEDRRARERPREPSRGAPVLHGAWLLSAADSQDLLVRCMLDTRLPKALWGLAATVRPAC